MPFDTERENLEAAQSLTMIDIDGVEYTKTGSVPLMKWESVRVDSHGKWRGKATFVTEKDCLMGSQLGICVAWEEATYPNPASPEVNDVQRIYIKAFCPCRGDWSYAWSRFQYTEFLFHIHNTHPENWPKWMIDVWKGYTPKTIMNWVHDWIAEWWESCKQHSPFPPFPQRHRYPQDNLSRFGILTPKPPFSSSPLCN